MKTCNKWVIVLAPVVTLVNKMLELLLGVYSFLTFGHNLDVSLNCWKNVKYTGRATKGNHSWDWFSPAHCFSDCLKTKNVQHALSMRKLHEMVATTYVAYYILRPHSCRSSCINKSAFQRVFSYTNPQSTYHSQAGSSPFINPNAQ